MSEPTTTSEPDGGVDARLARIRRIQMVFALERYGPGYQQATGNGLRYVAEIVHATPDETAWLRSYAAEHPEVWRSEYRNDSGWETERRDRGELAFTASDTAWKAGRPGRSLELVDEAYAYGVLTEGQWRQLSDYILTHTPPAPIPPAPTPPADSASEVR